MDKIPSFQKNHDTLLPGLYARTDGNGITTFDLRFKKPNAGDYITPKTLHTVEHLLATVLRNGERKDEIVYFGPMGCRTRGRKTRQSVGSCGGRTKICLQYHVEQVALCVKCFLVVDTKE